MTNVIGGIWLNGFCTTLVNHCLQQQSIITPAYEIKTKDFRIQKKEIKGWWFLLLLLTNRLNLVTTLRSFKWLGWDSRGFLYYLGDSLLKILVRINSLRHIDWLLFINNQYARDWIYVTVSMYIVINIIIIIESSFCNYRIYFF